MIVNRHQQQPFGTHDRAALKLLDDLARRGSTRRHERNLKIERVLVRDYQGRRQTVTVAPDGYVWEGAWYSSLSAKAISTWASRGGHSSRQMDSWLPPTRSLLAAASSLPHSPSATPCPRSKHFADSSRLAA